MAEKLHNLTLDQEIQEASPASKAKSKLKSKAKAKEVKSPKKPSSPLKKPAIGSSRPRAIAVG